MAMTGPPGEDRPGDCSPGECLPSVGFAGECLLSAGASSPVVGSLSSGMVFLPRHGPGGAGTPARGRATGGDRQARPSASQQYYGCRPQYYECRHRGCRPHFDRTAGDSVRNRPGGTIHISTRLFLALPLWPGALGAMG